MHFLSKVYLIVMDQLNGSHVFIKKEFIPVVCKLRKLAKFCLDY